MHVMNLLPKKLFICCTLLIISLGWVKANPTSRDSLLAVLQNPQPDSALFQNYILLGEAYAKTQKDSSGIFLHKAGQLLKNFKVPRQKRVFSGNWVSPTGRAKMLIQRPYTCSWPWTISGRMAPKRIGFIPTWKRAQYFLNWKTATRPSIFMKQP